MEDEATPNRRPAWRVAGRRILCGAGSAAAGGAAAAFADVAAAGGAHLGAAGHAEGAVDRVAGDLLQQLGGGVGLAVSTPLDRRDGRDFAALRAVGVLGLEVVGSVVVVSDASRRALTA